MPQQPGMKTAPDLASLFNYILIGKYWSQKFDGYVPKSK